MHSRLRPSPAMIVALIALFVALGGSAAALSGTNTVFTDDVADDNIPASGENPAGGLVAADLRPDSVGTSEVAANALTGADIANTNSLTGPEIDEASLEGVTRANSTNPSATSGCCEIISRSMTTSDPYALFNFATWIDFGIVEMRAPTSDNSAGSGFRLCSTGPNVGVVIYRGGTSLSTAETRSTPTLIGGSCTAVDYNGTDNTAFGDFRLYLKNDGVVVFGVGSGNASSASIRVFAINA